jgi:hypothetical protein
VNQAEKRDLTAGRASIVGGTQLSTTKLSGNKFWKHLLRKYATQLLGRDPVPAHLLGYTELVTVNHNKWHGTQTCSVCFKANGTKNHGHSKHQHDQCPNSSKNFMPHVRAKIERNKRKADEFEQHGGLNSKIKM